MEKIGFLIFIILVSLISNPAVAAQKDSKPIPQKGLNLVVTIEGLPPVEKGLVALGLSIKKAEKEKKLDEDRIESLHHLAPQEIQTTLEALGYYHSQVTSTLTPVLGGVLG